MVHCKRTLLLLTIILLTASSQAAAAQSELPRVTASEAKAHVGERVTVCDEVASTRYARTSRGQPTFLNLGQAYPDHVFSIVIWQRDRPKFDEPEKTLKGKRVCVTGLVELYRDKPQIVATEPSQLEVEDDSSAKGLSDAELRQILIRDSIARYTGSCPCPYNRDRAGRRCGRRSAYSRPGGASPTLLRERRHRPDDQELPPATRAALNREIRTGRTRASVSWSR